MPSGTPSTERSYCASDVAFSGSSCLFLAHGINTGIDDGSCNGNLKSVCYAEAMLFFTRCLSHYLKVIVRKLRWSGRLQEVFISENGSFL